MHQISFHSSFLFFFFFLLFLWTCLFALSLCNTLTVDVSLTANITWWVSRTYSSGVYNSTFLVRQARFPNGTSLFSPITPPPFLPFSLSPFVPFSLSPFVPFSLSPFLPFSLSPFLPFSLSPSFLSNTFQDPPRLATPLPLFVSPPSSSL